MAGLLNKPLHVLMNVWKKVRIHLEKKEIIIKGNWGVSYELPDPVYEELRKRAKEGNISISQIIRGIIEKELSAKDK